MADADVDALILGREANARYVSGARRLWLAGARTFAPGCVLVRATRDVHVLSTSADGIPSDIPVDHLYPIMWNPTHLMARLAAIPGLGEARRIGVDAGTPLMDALLSATFPRATFVDGQAVMLAARVRKLTEEVDAIRRALALTAQALDGIATEVRPGIRERDLLGRFEQRVCELGTTTPAFEGTFGRSLFPSDRPLERGEQVVLDAGILVDGYEGGMARTLVCGASQQPSSNPADELFAVLVDAVEPGASTADLWAKWDATGAPRPSQPMACGVGLGLEPPIIGTDSIELTAGMTISLRAELDGWVRRDIALVTATGADVLTARAGQ
jgi:Xaa-Pro aminopeptidase